MPIEPPASTTAGYISLSACQPVSTPPLATFSRSDSQHKAQNADRLASHIAKARERLQNYPRRNARKGPCQEPEIQTGGASASTQRTDRQAGRRRGTDERDELPAIHL